MDVAPDQNEHLVVLLLNERHFGFFFLFLFALFGQLPGKNQLQTADASAQLN